MTDESLQKLESPDPSLRRQAILDAGRAGDRRALPYLMKIYKTDPDPVMRELALKAGRRIKSLMDTATQDQPAVLPTVVESPPGAVSYTEYAFHDALAAPPPGPFVASAKMEPPAAPIAPITPLAPLAPIAPIVPMLPPIRKGASPRDRQMAKGRLDTAITHKIQGNTEKAVLSLADALRLNPDLETDGLAINLATSLTGLSAPADAMVAVKSAAALATAKPGQTRSGSASAESPIMNTLLEVLIYFAVTVVLWLILIVVVSRQSDAAFREMVPEQSQLMTNPLRGIAFLGMMVVIFVSAGVSTLITLFSNTIYYAIGIPLGGSGDWNRVISAMIRIQIVTAVAFAILLGLTLWLFPVPPDSASYAQLNQWAHGINVMGIVYLLAVLGSLGAMAYYVGRAHEFGFLKGLVTIVAGTVLQCCACFVLALTAVPAIPGRSY